MRLVLALSVCAVFAALSLLHLYWAAGGRPGGAAAVPSVDGTAAFTPSRTGTVAVALALLAAAVVVAMAGDLIAVSAPSSLTSGPALGLATILAARAIGDFHLIGFFKSAGGGSFAQLDTFVYSPLCMALAASIFWIVWSR